MKNSFDERQTYIPKNMTKRPETPNYDPTKNPFITREKAPVSEEKIPQKPLTMEEKYADLLNNDLSKAVLKAPEEETVREEVVFVPEAEKAVKDEENNVFIDDYFEIVGQVFDTYIIAEKGEEMLIIDQHAAHERLKYEELKREEAQKQIMPQMLIEPVVMELSGAEMDAFGENEQTFFEMGFECDVFGENSIIVRSVPGDIELGEVEDVMGELISQAQNLKKELITDRKQSLMYSVACKSAIKANKRLDETEMKALVRNVLRLENINTCPHGRPIIITMSKKEIEKEFKRIL